MLWRSKNRFWKWFEKNNGIFLDLSEMSEEEASQWLAELNIQLRKYHKSFFSVVETLGDQTTLFISVFGIRKHFRKIDALIAGAPVIPGWTFKALLEPGMLKPSVATFTREAGVDPDEFRFSFLNSDRNRAEIVVYHPHYTPEKDGPILTLVRFIIFNLVGEKSFGEHIKSIDVAHISEADPDKLEILGSLLTYFHTGYVITEEGSLAGSNLPEQ